MSKIGIKAARNVGQTGHGQEHATAQQVELSEEERSKDAFFVQIAEIAEAMIARHGRDFAIGAFLLSAKFLAEGKPLINRDNGGGETVSTVKPV
jgi:hypothetical protein